MSRALPPVGTQSTVLQLGHMTTVCEWLNTVVLQQGGGGGGESSRVRQGKNRKREGRGRRSARSKGVGRSRGVAGRLVAGGSLCAHHHHPAARRKHTRGRMGGAQRSAGSGPHSTKRPKHPSTLHSHGWQAPPSPRPLPSLKAAQAGRTPQPPSQPPSLTP